MPELDCFRGPSVNAEAIKMYKNDQFFELRLQSLRKLAFIIGFVVFRRFPLSASWAVSLLRRIFYGLY